MKTFASNFRIKLWQTTAYHPQANGLTEQMNQTIKRGLSRTQDQLNWDIYLPAILFSIHISKATATQQTPFYLVYGREVQDPAEPVQPNLMKRVTKEIAQLHKVRQQA